jgi:hypothetical protein
MRRTLHNKLETLCTKPVARMISRQFQHKTTEMAVSKAEEGNSTYRQGEDVSLQESNTG